jgi:hypothetical protein
MWDENRADARLRRIIQLGRFPYGCLWGVLPYCQRASRLLIHLDKNSNLNARWRFRSLRELAFR